MLPKETILEEDQLRIVPFCAVMAVPFYNFSTRLTNLQLESFLGNIAAIASLQGSVAESINIESFRIINCIYPKTLALDKYERNIMEQMVVAVRAIRQEWPTKTSATVKSAMNNLQNQNSKMSNVFYNLTLKNVSDFESDTGTQIRKFLEKINFMMSNTLVNLIRQNLIYFNEMIKDLCSCDIQVQDIRQIKVTIPPKSIYKIQTLPPMFSISFQVTNDLKVLNHREVKKREDEIAEWHKSQSNKKKLEKCPIQPLPPVMGKGFEYNVHPDDYKQAVLSVFDNIIYEFNDLSHIRKSIMEKVYFPTPKEILSVSPDDEDVKTYRQEISDALDRAVLPLKVYLDLFSKYETFMSFQIEEYIASRITVTRKEVHVSKSGEASTEIELPLTLNLNQVTNVINEHYNQIHEIEESLPIHPIFCGLFLVDVVSVRNLLLDKHRSIIRLILSSHTKLCTEICAYLEDEFNKIIGHLNRRPENIEEVVEIEEYISNLNAPLASLQQGIMDLNSYYDILDKYKFKSDFSVDLNSRKWNVFFQPNRIIQLCGDVHDLNETIRKRFLEDMKDEQTDFVHEVFDVEEQIKSLNVFRELHDVTNIAKKVMEVSVSVQEITKKASLFNSREVLFDCANKTDYEKINYLAKEFEPYYNLWVTSRDWMEQSHKWLTSPFVSINAEEVETQVDKFFFSINKACKYFHKNEMEAQLSIGNIIKNQIQDFKTNVPLIVLLRNPGMRQRHWEDIAEQCKVDIMPIEKFTTDELLQLNLNQQIEYITKVSESAAKEFQIEQILTKMQNEWDKMILDILPYKDTGTGVLKGVDDINAVLDEQITMTQTILFSAFKGPFEQQIEEWNTKLLLISEVLEVWMSVQRSWLYLQPIFESPDINRQLPAEGKKFATVDKNWRQTMSTAKGDIKVIDFCNR